MSAKWQRSKAWDDRRIPSWAWPAKFALRALSSIWLAVILLTLVALYGVLASVPIGMLAQTPTFLLYGLSIAGALALVAALPVMALRAAVGEGRPALRAAATLLATLALSVAALWLWRTLAWPMLRWDPAHGTGVRFFAGFCDAYASTTLRRLPAFEMSELEFYSWWPLRVVLLLFVVNMIMATARRIEFCFPNIGVLTVHTGIVVLALGSMHYQGLKEEGDALLLASFDDPAAPGPPTFHFYDNTRVALWIGQPERGWEQRLLPRLPRYNDYGDPISARTLDVEPVGPPASFIDPDIDVRVTGYGSYVELREEFEPRDAAARAGAPNPLIDVELVTTLPDAAGDESERVWSTARLAAGVPSERVASIAETISLEHVPASQTERWTALTTPLPERADHALVISVPRGEPGVYAAREGGVIEHAGHRIVVQRITPTAPFPIITPGFEGADSSVVVLEVTTPAGDVYERYVYHRFPELDQDIVGFAADGRPSRRPADRALRIAHIDASALHVYLREDGVGAVRSRGGDLAVIESVPVGRTLGLAEKVGLRVAARWAHGEAVEIPEVVPDDTRQKDLVGTHGAAAVRVELSLPDGWRREVWLPFAKYMGVGMDSERVVELPDGRVVALAFGRLRRPLPGIALQMLDFEMIPYPHSDIPRDYVAQLRVVDTVSGESYDRIARLNRPLIHRVPFRWSDERPLLANVMGAAVGLIAPNQYKFSQAGWDMDGWKRSLAETEAGRLDRPRATFTILGVGNNPGIYVIAAGGVMMAVGIPWAFYVKPMIMRHRKRRLQRQLGIGAGTSADAAEEPAPAGATT